MLDGHEMNFRSTLFVLVGVALSASCANSERTANSEMSFEPFFASRMWGVSFGPTAPTPVSDEFVVQLEELARKITSDLSVVDEHPANRTDLDPAMSSSRRSAWAMIPFVVLQLQALPGHDDWQSIHVRAADAIVAVAKAADPSVDVGFHEDSAARNRESLQHLLTWFDEQSLDPQRLGYMIFTLDDGPWRLMPSQNACVPTESKPITGDFALRLCRQESGRWSIEGIRDDAPVWSRELTEVPKSALSFAPGEAIPLGKYGWRINMTFGELVHFYIDRRLEPMFYFTSW